MCTVPNHGGETAKYWAGGKGKAVLNEHDSAWVQLLNSTLHLNLSGKSSEAYDEFKKWLSKPANQTELAALALNIAYGSEDGKATVQDPVNHDWPTLDTLVARIAALPTPAAASYKSLLEAQWQQGTDHAIGSKSLREVLNIHYGRSLCTSRLRHTSTSAAPAGTPALPRLWPNPKSDPSS